MNKSYFYSFLITAIISMGLNFCSGDNASQEILNFLEQQEMAMEKFIDACQSINTEDDAVTAIMEFINTTRDYKERMKVLLEKLAAKYPEMKKRDEPPTPELGKAWQKYEETFNLMMMPVHMIKKSYKSEKIKAALTKMYKHLGLSLIERNE